MDRKSGIVLRVHVEDFLSDPKFQWPGKASFASFPDTMAFARVNPIGRFDLCHDIVGFEQVELINIPPPDLADWEAYEAAR
jgi:hypothetical protein